MIERAGDSFGAAREPFEAEETDPVPTVVKIALGRHSPDIRRFRVRIALLSGLDNGNSPLSKQKGDRSR
jgi:hypothetical protein